jgi:hypothetical protein
MIQVYGSSDTAEGQAAHDLANLIRAAWPWMDTSADDHAALIASVKSYGQKVTDLDLVVLVDCRSDRGEFLPTVSLHDGRGDAVAVDRVRVSSLCLMIEVKDHSPANVRFDGPVVSVWYTQPSGHWHDATAQNEKQMYALRGLIESEVGRDAVPFIVELVWLRNVDRRALPSGKHKLLPRRFSWSGALDTVVQHLNVRREPNREGRISARSAHNGDRLTDLAAMLTRRLEPTDLDRRRMDRIAHEAVDPVLLADGTERQIVFVGRGGTGKTVRMLALAARRVAERHERVLLLTYNLALVADLRRLLTLMDVTDADGEPAITVSTVHSFLPNWFAVADLPPLPTDGDFTSFPAHVRQMLDLLLAGTLTAADLDAARADGRRGLAFDYVMVDEGQDWPTDERDLLHRLYPASRFVVADGNDQLVRGADRCDWAVAGCPTRRVTLQTGLRMKPNLAKFANALAVELGLSGWSIGANPDASGGRVRVVDGAYADAREVHAAAVEAAVAAGNQPIDLLACVPPQLVDRDGVARRSPVADLLRSWGQPVWDGTDPLVRRTFPVDVTHLRLLQYESCRGLEGWTVFAVAADQFFDLKVADWRAAHPAGAGSDPVSAQRMAARWFMMPVTRAIDTLVINVGRHPSPFRSAIRAVAEQMRDVVEWTTV